METQTEDKIERIVRDQAVKCIQLDFNDRYEMDHIRVVLGAENARLLNGISQTEIDMLKEFFFNTIYPRMGEREERDKSFESMVTMLKHPAKLGRFIPSLPLLVIRYARIWPTAVNVGISAMMAYLYSLRIEALVAKEAMALCQERGVAIDERFDMDMDLYEAAFVRVPYTHSKRMLHAAIKVMNAGKNPSLVRTTRNIINDVLGSFQRLDKQRAETGQPPVYGDIIRALEFGERVLDQVDTVFGAIGQDNIGRVIKITQLNETHHLDTLYGRI